MICQSEPVEDQELHLYKRGHQPRANSVQP